jgi:hypothetical protein
MIEKYKGYDRNPLIEILQANKESDVILGPKSDP